MWRRDGLMVFWEIGLSKWDIAAGALLVKEAGGIVTDFNEKQAWMKTGNIVAANAKIYDEFIKIIQKNMSEELKKSMMVMTTWTMHMFMFNFFLIR